MKRIWTVLFLFWGFKALGCHGTSMSEVSATDNGDGTFTYEIEVCVSDSAADSESFGFWVDWTGGGSLVSYQDSIVGSYTNNQKNASVPPVSGDGSLEYGDWDDTSTDTLTPSYEGECFTITLTFDEPMQSFSGGGMQPNYTSDGCDVSTSATYVCNSSYTYKLNVDVPSCMNKTYDIDFNGNTVANNVPTNGGSASYKYCGDCSFSFSAIASSGGCSMNSWEILDSLGNVNTSGTGDVSGKTVTTCTLPVEMLSFKASCKNDRVELNWKTASEQNNAYFEVQQSQDGEQFRTIDKVEGAGTTPYGKDYSLRVNSTGSPTYYRLVQVDKDGKEHIYGPVVADGCPENETLEVLVRDNGSRSPDLLIRSTVEKGDVELRFFDAQGRLVRKSHLRSGNGSQRFQLEKELEPGVYYVRLNAEGGMKTEKLVIGQ